MSNKLVPVHIALAGKGPEGYSRALQELRTAGLEDANLLEEVGLVTGKVSKDRLDALKRLPGCHVEVDGIVDVGPPDAPVK